MKLIKFSALALCAIMLGSCDNKGKVDLSSKDTTPSDSIGYLLGEIIDAQHMQYIQMNDTTMKSEEALEAYSKGFAKGLGLLKENDEAYNKGVMDAISAHLQVLQVNKELGSDISTNAIMSGFKAANHKEIDQAEMQNINNKLHEITTRLQAVKNKAKSAEANKKVTEEAKKAGFKAKNGLNIKVVKEGTGDNLKVGQNIKANVKIADKKGQDLFPAMDGTTLTVGQTPFSPLMEKALPMLKVGSIYTFMASPADMFGEQLPPQVEAAEPLLLTIEVVGVEEAAPAADVQPAK